MKAAFVIYLVIAIIFVVLGVIGFWSTLNPYYTGNAGGVCIVIIFIGCMSGTAAHHCYSKL